MTRATRSPPPSGSRRTPGTRGCWRSSTASTTRWSRDSSPPRHVLPFLSARSIPHEDSSSTRPSRIEDAPWGSSRTVCEIRKGFEIQKLLPEMIGKIRQRLTKYQARNVMISI
jgi:hypothetical protein